jgi:hypothetical protein
MHGSAGGTPILIRGAQRMFEKDHQHETDVETGTGNEEQKKGNPAQTGRHTQAGMGTEKGSGFAPEGQRFGNESTEGDSKGDEKRREG